MKSFSTSAATARATSCASPAGAGSAGPDALDRVLLESLPGGLRTDEARSYGVARIPQRPSSFAQVTVMA